MTTPRGVESYFFALPVRPAGRRGVVPRLELALRTVVVRLPRAANRTSSRSLAIRRRVRPRVAKRLIEVLEQLARAARHLRAQILQRRLGGLDGVAQSAERVGRAPRCAAASTGRAGCGLRLPVASSHPLGHGVPTREPTPDSRRLRLAPTRRNAALRRPGAKSGALGEPTRGGTRAAQAYSRRAARARLHRCAERSTNSRSLCFPPEGSGSPSQRSSASNW
jgi:hypothetical protein